MRNVKLIRCLVLSIGLLGSSVASADRYWNDGYDEDKFPGIAYIGKQMILNAKGNSTAYLCEVPPTVSGSTTALCFDLPLFDMRTGAYVGTITDALTDVVPLEGGGLTAIATSTFNFTQIPTNPSFTTRVLGNVQTIIKGSESMTHITGFIPGAGENNIIDSTGIFSYASGMARESGAVNLSTFQGQPGDKISADYLWVIKFD